MGNETVLLVEDEPAVRRLGSYVLRDQGYTVLDAGNGNEALRLAAEFGEQDIHLLFTDVVMPMMGGVELAQQLRFRHRDLRVVFTSGYTYGVSVAPVELHESSFLEKPYTPDTMSWKIREALDTRSDAGMQELAGASHPLQPTPPDGEGGALAGRVPATGPNTFRESGVLGPDSRSAPP